MIALGKLQSATGLSSECILFSPSLPSLLLPSLPFCFVGDGFFLFVVFPPETVREELLIEGPICVFLAN